MEVEYKRDLHHNYMVLKDPMDWSNVSHCIKMLSYQKIDGILAMERRVIDNQALYYYDITGKQSIKILNEKASFSFLEIKHLFLKILQIIEKASEYLLMEDDFILSPEFLYQEMGNKEPFLCYYSGYQQDIRIQITSFVEYTMNKVNYNDEEAVLLIYNLYAACKEDGFALHHLFQFLYNGNRRVAKKQDINASGRNSSREEEEEAANNSMDHTTGNTMIEFTGNANNTAVYAIKNKRNSARNTANITLTNKIQNTDTKKEEQKECNKKKYILKTPKVEIFQPNAVARIPIMLEKLVGEKEIAYYPMLNYIYTATCIVGGILVIAVGFLSKFIYTSLGNRIDLAKLFGLLLLILCLEGYLLAKIWDKKKKHTKLILQEDYVDPIQEMEEDSKPWRNKSTNETVFLDSEEEVDNPTCILAEITKPTSYYLKPYDQDNFETIRITNFPFFIGKTKLNVDYCLKNEAISRYHAKITKDQEHFFITDLNSTNGTFINNEAVLTYQIKELQIGDEVMFANIRYQFIKQ